MKHLYSLLIFMVFFISCKTEKEIDVSSLEEQKYLAPVKEQIEAYNARNLERFINCYSEDIIIEDAQCKIMMQGHDQMRDLYGKLFSESPNLNAKILSRFQVGEYVFDKEHATGINLEGYPPEVFSAAIYHVKNEKIVHVRLIM